MGTPTETQTGVHYDYKKLSSIISSLSPIESVLLQVLSK